MTPTIIERAVIDWTPIESRFSTQPRTVPVSGRPAAMPEAQPVRPQFYEDRHTSVAARKVVATNPKPRTSPVLYNRGTRNIARNPNSNRGTQSAISLEVCPATGQAHDWRSSGARQDKCSKCPRSRMASSVPVDERIPRPGRWKALPPVVLLYPENWGTCKESLDHDLQRAGWKDGRPQAICSVCGKQGRRVADASEVRA